MTPEQILNQDERLRAIRGAIIKVHGISLAAAAESWFTEKLSLNLIVMLLTMDLSDKQAQRALDSFGTIASVRAAILSHQLKLDHNQVIEASKHYDQLLKDISL